MRIGFQIVKFVEIEAVEYVLPLFCRDRALGVVELYSVALKADALSPVGGSISAEERH